MRLRQEAEAREPALDRDRGGAAGPRVEARVVHVHDDVGRLGVAVGGERGERGLPRDRPQPHALAREHDRVDHGEVGAVRHHAAERAARGIRHRQGERMARRGQFEHLVVAHLATQRDADLRADAQDRQHRGRASAMTLAAQRAARVERQGARRDRGPCRAW